MNWLAWRRSTNGSQTRKLALLILLAAIKVHPTQNGEKAPGDGQQVQDPRWEIAGLCRGSGARLNTLRFTLHKAGIEEALTSLSKMAILAIQGSQCNTWQARLSGCTFCSKTLVMRIRCRRWPHDTLANFTSLSSISDQYRDPTVNSSESMLAQRMLLKLQWQPLGQSATDWWRRHKTTTRRNMMTDFRLESENETVIEWDNWLFCLLLKRTR